MPSRNLISLLAALMLLYSAGCANAGNIKWSGYTWIVRNSTGGPGPNTFSPSNVSLDSNGYLHLKITKVGNTWTCAEIQLKETLGFGTYQFFVTGAVDQLDKNVVLGLFDYPNANVGPDGTHEIDIECSRWGNASNPPGNYTVYPAVVTDSNVTHPFPFTLTTPDSTHRFTWSASAVSFQTLSGHTDGTDGLLASWTTPASFASMVPHGRVPAFINLWLDKGMAPSDGNSVEVIITAFKFTAPGK